MLIPHDLLEADTLNNLLEDFVTREGTDNGDETPLNVRVERARHALRRGEAVICGVVVILARGSGWRRMAGGQTRHGFQASARQMSSQIGMVWIARFQPDSEDLLSLDRAGMRSQ